MPVLFRTSQQDTPIGGWLNDYQATFTWSPASCPAAIERYLEKKRREAAGAASSSGASRAECPDSVGARDAADTKQKGENEQVSPGVPVAETPPTPKKTKRKRAKKTKEKS